jgi:hypothetical protein
VHTDLSPTHDADFADEDDEDELFVRGGLVSGGRGRRERGSTFSRKDSTSFWYFCGRGERGGRWVERKRKKREKRKSA